MVIIKNFLDKKFFNSFFNDLNSSSFPWFFRDHQVGDYDKPYFTHSFYNKRVTSSGFDLHIVPILEKLKCVQPVEIRANLVLNYNKHFISAFHTDTKLKCKTAILYMNNCDGYTIIDDKEVKCEKNKIVIFDSTIKHAGVSQTNTEKRIVLNLNYFDLNE